MKFQKGDRVRWGKDGLEGYVSRHPCKSSIWVKFHAYGHELHYSNVMNTELTFVGDPMERLVRRKRNKCI